MKLRLVFNILVFTLILTASFGSTVVKAGNTLKATEDMTCFTKEESAKIIAKFDELDQLKKDVEVYKKNEEKYTSAIREKDLAIDSYKQSVTLLEFSINQYKSILTDLRGMLKEQSDANVQLGRCLLDFKRLSNDTKKTNFITGLITDGIRAYGLSKLKVK